MKIAHEHIMKFRTKEFVVIFIFAIVAFMINYLFSLVFDSSYLFIVGVFVLVLLLDLLVYLYKKSFVAMIFLTSYGVMSFNFLDFGVIGFDKVIGLFLVSIIFELIFLVWKLNVYGIYVDVVLASSVMMLFFPLLNALLVSFDVVYSFPVKLINLMLVSFGSSLLASGVSYIIWRSVMGEKFMLKFRAYLRRLG
jgi:hypothetical protein